MWAHPSDSLKGHVGLCCDTCTSKCMRGIPQTRRLVSGLKASSSWPSAQQRLTKWTWQSMSSGEGTGRCTVLRCCSGNGTGFAKLHPFASWNCLALHNLDSKGWLMGLFLQWKEKENVETINYVLKEGLTPSWNQLPSSAVAGSSVNRIQIVERECTPKFYLMTCHLRFSAR